MAASDYNKEAKWGAAFLDHERMALLINDITRLSFMNRLYDPNSIKPMYAALEQISTMLRPHLSKGHREKLDKVFNIMRVRIYSRQMLNEEGQIDTRIFDDLQALWNQLYVYRQKLNLGIPTSKKRDIGELLRKPMGLEYEDTDQGGLDD